MTDDTLRSLTITRTDKGRYSATNARGVTLEFGHGEDLFSPVQLLLAALAGCAAIDVDYVVSRRAEPTTFDVTASGHRFDNMLQQLKVEFDVNFDDSPEGREAAGLVERVIKLSHEKDCTVSRTLEAGGQIDMHAVGRN